MNKWENTKPHINVGTMRHHNHSKSAAIVAAIQDIPTVRLNMSEFQKYKSIENHYREKFLNDTLQFHPQYHTCKYVAQEKIHGANFQVLFTDIGDGAITIEFGKRSGIIAHNESFYNHHATVQRQEYVDLFENVCKFMRNLGAKQIILYGEFAGPGVQSGVDYGDKKFVKFFDIVIDGKYETPKNFYLIMDDLDAIDLTVPSVGIFDTLKTALDLEVEGVESIVFPKEGNVWEGVVIKPWDYIAENSHGEQVLFYIKKKDPKFGDKQKKSKDKRADLPQELHDAQHAFSEYLTETRLQDVISKHGPITSDKQVGQYIKYMMEDAKTDYLKDYKKEFIELSDKYKSKVFSITGKIVAPMLMKLV